jgi:peptide chain release factor subunit 3
MVTVDILIWCELRFLRDGRDWALQDMGTVVIGKIESGQVTRGQYLLLMPNRVRIQVSARILSVFRVYVCDCVRLQTTVQVIQLWSDENETDRAVSGENVKIKLKGVEDADILSGFVLCSSDAPCRVGRIFDAEVRGKSK